MESIHGSETTMPERIQYIIAAITVTKIWQAVASCAIAVFTSIDPIIWTLFGLQFVDSVMGYRSGLMRRRTDRHSDIDRKGTMWVYIGIAYCSVLLSKSLLAQHGIDQYVPPFGRILAAFYVTVVVLSIFRYGTKMGQPPPEFLRRRVTDFASAVQRYEFTEGPAMVKGVETTTVTAITPIPADPVDEGEKNHESVMLIDNDTSRLRRAS